MNIDIADKIMLDRYLKRKNELLKHWERLGGLEVVGIKIIEL